MQKYIYFSQFIIIIGYLHDFFGKRETDVLAFMYFCRHIYNQLMNYQSSILPNGIRMVHLPVDSPVAYCGFAINAGTRDELSTEFGLAHFVEHMIFKGTTKRKSWHILNRMERVGGEFNAYTTTEETFVYSLFM